MTAPDLERRLTDLLRERAEDAMERTNMHEKLSPLLVDGERGLRRRRRVALAAGLVAAAALVVAAVWLGRPDADRARPVPAAPPDSAAALATRFLEANYAYDLEAAAGMLAPDAEVVVSSSNGWRSERAWDEVAGVSLADYSCRPKASSTAGTQVHCEFELNALGSEQLGRGPFGDNTFDLTIRDGKITGAEETWAYGTNGFSDEMWVPFSDWVRSEHSGDLGVMYNSDQTEGRVTPRSLGLWERRVAEYVDTHR